MTATAAASKETKRASVPMNGVDTPTLFATINAVGAEPELAKFQFRAKSRWLSGTHSQSTMHDFFGAGGEHWHVAPYSADSDHPAVLCGADSHQRRSGFRRRQSAGRSVTLLAVAPRLGGPSSSLN